MFATLLAGQRSEFISPTVLGEGVREGDGWRFSWQHNGRSGTALIELGGNGAILSLEQAGRDLEDADRLTLQRANLIADERIDLAPRTNAGDWQHWFDTVLVGHFFAADMPAC